MSLCGEPKWWMSIRWLVPTAAAMSRSERSPRPSRARSSTTAVRAELKVSGLRLPRPFHRLAITIMDGGPWLAFVEGAIGGATSEAARPGIYPRTDLEFVAMVYTVLVDVADPVEVQSRLREMYPLAVVRRG